MALVPSAGFRVVHVDRDGDVLIQFNNAQTVRWVQQKDFVKMMAETKLKTTQPTNTALHQVWLKGFNPSKMCEAQIWSFLEQTQYVDIILDLFVEGTHLVLIFPTGETARQAVKFFDGRLVGGTKLLQRIYLCQSGRLNECRRKQHLGRLTLMIVRKTLEHVQTFVLISVKMHCHRRNTECL